MGQPVVSSHIWESGIFAVREVVLDLEHLTVVLGEMMFINKKLSSTGFTLDLLLYLLRLGLWKVFYL